MYLQKYIYTQGYISNTLEQLTMEDSEQKWEVKVKGKLMLKAKRKDLHRPILMVCHELRSVISSILITQRLKNKFITCHVKVSRLKDQRG